MEPDKASEFRQETDDVPIIESFSLPDNSTLKVALEPGYSLQFDDLPRKFQIRIMDRRSISPPRAQLVESPRSTQWMADYGPPRWNGESSRVTKGQVRLPPSPSWSKEQMQEELRGDLLENAAPTAFTETCDKCGGINAIERNMEERIFLRRPSAQYLSAIDERRNLKSSSSISSSEFIDCQRPHLNFQRNNVMVDGLDFHEMHPNLTPKEQPQAQATPLTETPNLAKMPPDDAYNAEKYCSPPESPRSASVDRCSWHKQNSCPVTAGYRCRENMGFESPESARSPGEGSNAPDLCSYHRNLSCPATAGVRCRCEITTSPPIDRLSEDHRNDVLRPNVENFFIPNSCMCLEAQVKNPSQEPILPPPPQAIDAPIPSCHCE